MQRYTISVLAALLFASALLATGSDWRSHGAAMPAKPEPIALGEAIGQFEGEGRLHGKFEGRITEVCRKKGCWMVLTDGEIFARVRFKDYGFFVPVDTAGRRSIVQGELAAVTLEPDQLNHYEEDAGRSGSFSEPRRAWEITATSVLIESAGE